LSMVAVLLVDVGLAIYILPKDPAMDLFIYSDGVQVDFTIGEKNYSHYGSYIQISDSGPSGLLNFTAESEGEASSREYLRRNLR